MSTTTRAFWVVAPVAAALAAIAIAAPANPSPEAARCDTYTTAEGDSYFALSLTPPDAAAAPGPRDLVLLFDTSASQTGAYREKSLAVLNSLLASLDEQDRVQLVAVDLKAIPLTKSFVAPRGADMSQALAQLQRRVPLGSTDMAAALSHAAASLAKRDAPRAAIYIGDGLSNANFLAEQSVALIDRLVAARISVTSCAIGPQPDNVLLAGLANHTGGMLLVDHDDAAAEATGQRLAEIAKTAVIWPTSLSLSEPLKEVYPAQTPPLRADRDTILIGKGACPASIEVRIAAETDGKPVELKWNVSPNEPNDDHAYLAQLVSLAAPTQGNGLPTLGSEGLAESKRMVNQGAAALAQLGRQAAVSGHREQADKLVNEALRRDPNSAPALAVKTALEKPPVQQAVATRPADEGDLRLVQADPPITRGAPPAPAPRAAAAAPPAAAGTEEPPEDGGFLEEFDQRNRVIADKIKADTTVQLGRFRDRMATDPRGVEQDAKLLLDQVQKAPELSADDRAQLRDRIATAIREAKVSGDQLDVVQLERDRRAAAGRENLRVLDGLVRKQDKVKQLIDRFNSLTAEGKYVEAEESAMLARNEEPERPDLVSAVEVARVTGYHIDNMIVREKTQKGYIETLHLVDVSHIPFPDEPAIIYPSAQFWQKLTEDRAKYKSVDLKGTGTAEEKINKALEQPTDVDYAETELKDVIEDLKAKHGIEIQIDDAALKDAGLDATPPKITRSLKGITLRSALRLMLKEHALTYMIQDEVLLITTKDAAATQMVTKVYPVADLVLPISSGVGANPFAQGGGLGGQGGFGGGLGGGGGGFGGGGGGFGGGGGGFGGGQGGFGGGAFNLPDPVARGQLPRGFQAFAVPDDLKLSSKKPAAAPSTEAPVDRPVATTGRPAATAQPGVAAKAAAKTAAKKAARIVIDIPPGTDAGAAWDQYFTTLPVPAEEEAIRVTRVRESAVRETARQLMAEKEFAEVIGLIHAALRNGHAQSWMYEGLGLAMQASDQPKQEIERALMSAVDFASTANDLMQVGGYLARIECDQRALTLFRQASAVEPFRHEPYMHGLDLAVRLNDTAGIEWAACGVLNQVWPNDKAEVVAKAERAAAATIERLRGEERASEADAFQAAIDRALVRDCLVKVTWTGDADVDLIIEEPSGTVCSFSSPRSTSGGVLLTEADLRGAKIPKGASCEGYIAPQGFSGGYRMLIRRAYGKVATGKVTVDIAVHHGDKNARYIHEQVPLGEKDAVVMFDLQDGRRKQPLAEAQLANAAAGALAINRAILAQQLSGLNDPSVIGGLAGGARGFAGGQFPFGGRGAVGFQPVITTLPEGTNMTATAVISADRRYVRITPIPLFSLISEVNTFNFVSGQGGTQGPGTGGGATGGGFGGGGFGGFGT